MNRYPDRTNDEVEDTCPFCYGNCNCGACLQKDVFLKVCKQVKFTSCVIMYYSSGADITK